MNSETPPPFMNPLPKETEPCFFFHFHEGCKEIGFPKAALSGKTFSPGPKRQVEDSGFYSEGKTAPRGGSEFLGSIVDKNYRGIWFLTKENT